MGKPVARLATCAHALCKLRLLHTACGRSIANTRNSSGSCRGTSSCNAVIQCSVCGARCHYGGIYQSVSGGEPAAGLGDSSARGKDRCWGTNCVVKLVDSSDYLCIVKFSPHLAISQTRALLKNHRIV